MIQYQRHFISPQNTVRQVLEQLNDLAPHAIGFVVGENNQLIGSVTDGDIRRGLIAGFQLEDEIIKFIQPNPHSLTKSEMTPQNFDLLTGKRIKVVPLVDDRNQIIDIINLDDYISLLPMEAVIMAGGKGIRLKPLTDDTPKPMLKIGNKPIIEHMIDRLIKYGIQTIHISINYLGDQIKDYFGDGSSKGIQINYIEEDEYFGTAGALVLNDSTYHTDYLLFMNSDLLTNIDFADMYNELMKQQAEMIVGTVPYEVKVPYGIIETRDGQIKGLKEKPTFTYFSNAGIYIAKTQHINKIPKKKYYDATDFIQELLQQGFKIYNFPIRSYWLDIGKHHDFEKAQEDIKHIKL